MPARRTAAAISADLRARAAALDRKARIAESPALKLAIKLRARLDNETKAAVMGSPENVLIVALDAFIGEDPDGL